MNRATLLALVCTTFPAVAGNVGGAPIPDIDVDKVCATHARGVATAANICVTSEQRGYDVLVTIWSQVSLPVKEKCLAMDAKHAREGNPFRYTNLADCLVLFTEQEILRGDRPSPGVRFQR